MMLREIAKTSANKAIGIIRDSLKACLENKATFPEHVKTISEAGVTNYKVDLLKYTATYKLQNNFTHTENLPSLDTKPSQLFNQEGVKNAIKEVQRKNIDYVTFLKTIISAGTTYYEVDIAAKYVTYVGVNQESYVELFPNNPTVTTDNNPNASFIPICDG